MWKGAYYYKQWESSKGGRQHLNVPTISIPSTTKDSMARVLLTSGVQWIAGCLSLTVSQQDYLDQSDLQVMMLLWIWMVHVILLADRTVTSNLQPTVSIILEFNSWVHRPRVLTLSSPPLATDSLQLATQKFQRTATRTTPPGLDMWMLFPFLRLVYTTNQPTNHLGPIWIKLTTSLNSYFQPTTSANLKLSY